MTIHEEKFDLTNRILNELVFSILNPTPYFPSEDTAQAIDMFGERVKVGLAGVTVALLEVAKELHAANEKIT